jgi:hypothetical protein
MAALPASRETMLGIGIASDHQGLDLKRQIASFLGRIDIWTFRAAQNLLQ